MCVCVCVQAQIEYIRLPRGTKVRWQAGGSVLISWLQSPSAVILEPKKIKSVISSTFSLSICHEMMGPDAMILVFF